MIKAKVIISSVAIIAALGLVSTAQARGNSSFGTNNLMGIANKQTKCFLYKMSVKGKNGFFGGNDKSIEATCQDAGGEDFEFSANGSFHKDLVQYAAQEVIVVTGPNKGNNNVDDAKTDNIIISIKPVHDVEVNEHRICGPENPDSINYDVKESKIYSAGYRVARPVSFDKVKNQWHMKSYVGIEDDNEWNNGRKDRSDVIFTQGCSRMVHEMLSTDTPLIFDYMQTKENGVYTIGRAAVISSI